MGVLRARWAQTVAGRWARRFLCRWCEHTVVCAQAGPGSLSSWSPPPSRRRHPPPPSPPGRSLRACGAEGLGPRAAPRRPPHACLSAFEVTFINPCLERELLFLVCPDGRLQGQARRLLLCLPLALQRAAALHGLFDSPSPELRSHVAPYLTVPLLASVLGHRG